MIFSVTAIEERSFRRYTAECQYARGSAWSHATRKPIRAASGYTHAGKRRCIMRINNRGPARSPV